MADNFTKLCKVMFPDSKTAQEFASGRTKPTAIVKHALAPALNWYAVHLPLLCCVMAAMTRQTENTLELWSGLGQTFSRASYTISVYASVV